MAIIIFYTKGRYPLSPSRAFVTGNHFMILGIFSLIASQISRVSELSQFGYTSSPSERMTSSALLFRTTPG